MPVVDAPPASLPTPVRESEGVPEEPRSHPIAEGSSPTPRPDADPNVERTASPDDTAVPSILTPPPVTLPDGPLIWVPSVTGGVVPLALLRPTLPDSSADGAEGASDGRFLTPEGPGRPNELPTDPGVGIESTPAVASHPGPSAGAAGCEDDAEIARLAETSKPRIVVVGCGGGGSNTVDRCLEEGVGGAELCAINTDLAHLLTIRAHRKILLGRRSTRGRGAGARPEVGLSATLETEEELRHFLQGAQLAFVTAGLGGGTGTGSAPTIARIAKAEGAITVGVVTLPFGGEGVTRREIAVEGLEQLRKACDTTIVIENDRLLQTGPRMRISTAFKTADSVLTAAIKGITETITQPGLVNLDFADIRTIMRDGGVALVGLGKSSEGTDRAADAVKSALNSPLLGPVDLAQAKGAIVHVLGPPTMTVHEAQRAAAVVAEKVPKTARILWGCTIDAGPRHAEPPVRVLLIVTGVRVPETLRHPAAPAAATHSVPVANPPTPAPAPSTIVAASPPSSRASFAQRVRRVLRHRAEAH